MSSEAITPIEARPSRWRHALHLTASSKSIVAGGIVVGVILLFALFGQWLSGRDPLQYAVTSRFQPPSAEFLFGTDSYGRDVFARVVHGAGLSLLLGTLVVLCTGVIGTTVGALAGYFRKLDSYLMRVMDALMAFPSIMLAIAIAAALGGGTLNVVVALTVGYAPRTARIVRAAVIGVRDAEYVEAARLAGASHFRILTQHILPNSLVPLIVDQTFVFAYVIVADAALSFLGVGSPQPTPSWGNIIADGRDYIVDAPWITLFPGLLIAFTVLGLNMMGDGLRDILDPRLKST